MLMKLSEILNVGCNDSLQILCNSVNVSVYLECNSDDGGCLCYSRRDLPSLLLFNALVCHW